MEGLVTQAQYDQLHKEVEDVLTLLVDDVPNREQVTSLVMELAQAGTTFAGLEELEMADRFKVLAAVAGKLGAKLAEQAVVKPEPVA